MSEPVDTHLEAGWVVLRAWLLRDLAALYQAVETSRDHLIDWMPWATSWDVAAAEQFLSSVAADSPDRSPEDGGVYAIVDRSGQLLGGAGLHHRIGSSGLEVGYWVHVDHLRQGLASSAASLLTEHAFAAHGVSRVEIHHDKANVASAAVASNLGFKHYCTASDRAEAPGEIGVEIRWRMLRNAFTSSRAAEILRRARAQAGWSVVGGCEELER